MARSAPIHAGLVSLQGSQTCFSNTVHSIHINFSFCLLHIYPAKTNCLTLFLWSPSCTAMKKNHIFVSPKQRPFSSQNAWNSVWICVCSVCLYSSCEQQAVGDGGSSVSEGHAEKQPHHYHSVSAFPAQVSAYFHIDVYKILYVCIFMPYF